MLVTLVIGSPAPLRVRAASINVEVIGPPWWQNTH